MNERESLIKKMRVFLLLTGIIGALILIAYCYIGLNATWLVSENGTKHDNNFGMTVPVFAAAIAAAYSFISFHNIGELIKDGVVEPRRRKEFRAKFEKYIATTQGLLVCTVFALIYWLIYTHFLNITGYLDSSSKLQSIAMFNYIWEGLMLIDLIMSFMAARYATLLSRTK